ncbi:PKD domain-containing protein [Paraflavisolibacter sp. H34]|uniref:PKD domain-containing protein n=1 Tax=Huijunlia imazamoxiresistens TaxID=3127457 RepID=UPI003015C56E
MKKFLTFFLLLAGVCLTARASHITGGEMYYTLTGVSGSQYTYHVTMKLFIRCNSNRQLGTSISISAFDRASFARISDVTAPRTKLETLSLTDPNKCITDPPTVCFEVGSYETDLTLDLGQHPSGFLLATQENYRINGMTNLAGGYNQIGATYTAEVPGTTTVANGPSNNSAHFIGSDLVAICADNAFTYSFAAEDKDGDELRYSFCNAYESNNGGPNAVRSGAPPFNSVPYGSDFSGSTPLGSSVTVDPKTGLVSGRAPGSGTYVITVCVEEVRNGKVIATQRKDVQINIASCTIASAQLESDYSLCKDTRSLTLTNLSNSPLINGYRWEVRNPSGTLLFTSTSATFSYTFPTVGNYAIKLVTNPGADCSDSTIATAHVWPGFKPDFTYSGICFTKPTNFTDATTTVYGSVNSWKWDFGEGTTTTDIASEKAPSYTYPVQGAKTVRLIVGNDRGCLDTVRNTLTITAQPPIDLAFRDTLICVPDRLQLAAAGSGAFSWTPAAGMTGANTANPVVAPVATTTYHLQLDQGGCVSTDSVRVRVVTAVTLQAMRDTSICQGDALTLRVLSDALRYAWTASPAAALSDPSAAAPTSAPREKTTYSVTGTIGSCSATGQVVVTTVPYPVAHAGGDTIICAATSAQLLGSMDGDSLVWTPAASLSNRGILNPVARPSGTTDYVLWAYDHKGCPKPGRDTMRVTVLPPINAFAGRDTAVIVGQPLQLQATGVGTGFQWSPALYLSSAAAANPVALFPEGSEGAKYRVTVRNEAGCTDSAYLTVKVFVTPPSVFVPTGFTPNGDGLNDVLRPIAVGMTRIERFSVFNRWGQQVFATAVNKQGWDGRFGGMLQASGTFVWQVTATDYLGKKYFLKGTSTLIR